MANDKKLQKAFESSSNKQKVEKPNFKQNLDVPIKIIAESAKNKTGLTSIINRLAKSETGKETLETMAKAGYSIKYEFMFGANGGTSKSKKMVVLNPQFTEEQLVGVLAHEARHVGQFERGELDSEDISRPRNYDIKSEIMKYRATEADA